MLVVSETGQLVMLVVMETGQLVTLVTDAFQVAVPVSDAGR